MSETHLTMCHLCAPCSLSVKHLQILKEIIPGHLGSMYLETPRSMHPNFESWAV
jgi:hypothetical protein